MSQSIEWRHDRRRIILPVVLIKAKPSLDRAGSEGCAQLDTGATTCGITARAARVLELPKRGKRPLGSAQGEGQAERYVFRVGLVMPSDQPAFPYVFDDVTGFELSDSFQFEALIGMDILSQCEFSMSRSQMCRLTFG
jgi:hypothetical protein